MVLLKSCGCISLRCASILIGIAVLGLASYLFVVMLAIGILWQMTAHKEADITFGLIQTISIEYLNGMQILFAFILIYGCIKEVSSCVLGWLVLQLAICVDSIITIAMVSVMHAYFIPQDFALLVLLGGILYVVYSYYELLPKPVAK